MDIICGLLLGVIVLWAIVGAIYDKLRGINDDIQYALFKLDRIEYILAEYGTYQSAGFIENKAESEDKENEHDYRVD